VLDDIESLDPTDMEDIDRGFVGGEEFVDADNSVDESTKSGLVAFASVDVEDGVLAKL
jgi:hypothetical protein